MTKFSKIALSSMVALGAFLPALTASAQNMAVSATVASNCIVTAAPLAFGAYDPTVTNATTALDVTGSVTVNCTLDSVAHIQLGQGTHDIAGTACHPRAKDGWHSARRLSQLLLISEATHTTVWGNTPATGVDQTGTGADGAALLVYGRIPGTQNVAADAYTDTVVASVTF